MSGRFIIGPGLIFWSDVLVLMFGNVLERSLLHKGKSMYVGPTEDIELQFYRFERVEES